MIPLGVLRYLVSNQNNFSIQAIKSLALRFWADQSDKHATDTDAVVCTTVPANDTEPLFRSAEFVIETATPTRQATRASLDMSAVFQPLKIDEACGSLITAEMTLT